MNFAVTEDKAASARYSKKKLTYLAIIVLIIVAAIIATLFVESRQKPPSPIPAKFTKQLKIPLYYPTSLPNGWKVDANSFKLPAAGVLTFAITDNEQNRYYISEQLLPNGFDYTAFQKKFTKPDNFVSKAGSALVGQAGSIMIGSIRTPDNSWIIINTSNTDLLKQVEILARSLSSLQQ